jgi:transposase
LGVNSNTLYTWVHNASKPKGNTNVASNESVAKTIKRHWDGIISWKKSQINNAILEGLNSVLQAAKRKARGYKAQHFRHPNVF